MRLDYVVTLKNDYIEKEMLALCEQCTDEISVAFSAQKRPFYAVLLRFASALAKVNAKQEKKEKE